MEKIQNEELGMRNEEFSTAPPALLTRTQGWWVAFLIPNS